MRNKALFITFEGCEGCGKSTHSKLLSQWFTKNDIKNIVTREPGGTVAAERIRKILLDHNLSLEHSSELLLHFAARVEHVKNIILPNIHDGTVVICDRFFDSTIAYQHYGHGLDLDVMLSMHQWFLENLTPDITFLLEIPDDIFFKRKTKKSFRYTDRYENLHDNYHMKVRDGFKKLATINKDRYYIIDTSSSAPKDAHQKIVDIVSKKLAR